MYIANPNVVLLNSNDPVWLNNYMGYQKQMLANINMVIEPEMYPVIVDIISENCGVTLSVDLVKAMLSLYPETRIRLALEKDLDDGCSTDLCGLLMNTISQFFLSCSWPNYGDKTDMKAFCQLLGVRVVLFLNQQG